MPHPWFLLPALALLKKTTAGTVYYAAKGYGWPRTYRRILEINKAVNGGRPPKNEVAERTVRELTSAAIRTPSAQQRLQRYPPKVAEWLQNSHVVAMASEAATKQYAERTPAFVQSLMGVIANRTTAGKLLKEARDSTTAMKEAAAKRGGDVFR